MPSVHHLEVTRTARFVTLGELTDNTREVWLVLHGYGQLATDFIEFFKSLDDGTRYIVAPEGLSRFYAKGMEGKPAASWMTSEDRDNEIKDYIRYIDDIYTYLRLHWYSARLVVLGFSQGVATASRWLNESKRSTDVFVAYSGEIAIEMQQHIPVKFAQGPTWLYITGNNDPLITAEKHKQAFAIMNNLKAQVMQFDGGHELRSDMLLKAAQWIRERIGKKK